jgi:Integrase core domain
MASLGVSPRVCRPFKPQTKGKVERSVGVIKNGFWPGVHFTDIDHLNGQAKLWCDRLNQKVHPHARTTRKVPIDVWVEENLTPLPKAFAWERFGAEERHPSVGMASSPTMGCTTAYLQTHRWPVRWCWCANESSNCASIIKAN